VRVVLLFAIAAVILIAVILRFCYHRDCRNCQYARNILTWLIPNSTALGTWLLAIAAFVALEDGRRAIDQNQRAWFGHIDASMASIDESTATPLKEVTANTPFIVRTWYRNSGHEPATNIHFLDVLAEIYTTAQWDNGFAEEDIIKRQARCRSIKGNPGSIEFPTEQANMSVDIYFTDKPKDKDQLKGNITEAVINGDSKVVFMYCIMHESGGVPHHTAFGYYFQRHHVHPNHLGISLLGNDAD
jgi:hypothetical protein